MSDFDRGKYYGKKKSRESANNFDSRFFKSKSATKTGSKESLSENKQKVKQPTILLKTRERTEDRSLSPKRNATKETECSTPITIAAPAGSNQDDHPTIEQKQMTSSVKFLTDSQICTENVQDLLQENNDYLVVGVVGSQGVGKSTILNLLANSQVSEELKRQLFSKNPNDGMQILKEHMSKLSVKGEASPVVFKTQQMPEIESDCNTTFGIDLFISNNRVIYLDCQPFNSIAILDELIQSENKRSNLLNDFLPLENSGEIYGLQLTSFLMSVCHVLIIVQDWFFDSNVIRFIQTAEMLKPTISNTEEEIVDHFPHLVLLHNRAQMEDFTPIKFKIIQKIYKSVFNKTKLHLESGIGMSSGRLFNCLSSENCGDPINVYLIPEYTEDNFYKGHPPLEDLVKQLRANIMGATKFPLTHVQLNEKTWLIYCTKVWEHVKKSSFFVEYAKLMP